MVPKQPVLDVIEAEQLFQVVRGLVAEFLSTGDPARVAAPATLLNASRLMLVPDFAQSLRVYATLGMLHWIRHLRATLRNSDYDAAFRFFTHVYADDPQLVPSPMREQFDAQPPAPVPLWEVWHTVGRTLIEEFGRDRGERLLDASIVLFRMSLSVAPPDYLHRPAMDFNLGIALFERFDVLKERDDLDAAIESLQWAAQGPTDFAPAPSARWSLLGRALTARYESTRDASDLDGMIAAFRMAAPLDRPLADATALASAFSLGSALSNRFKLRHSVETLSEAIDAYRAVALQAPADHSMFPLFLGSAGEALLSRYGVTGDFTDLKESLDFAERADQAAPDAYPHKKALALNLAAVRQLYEEAQPQGRPQSAPSLSEQGDLLLERYEMNGDIADLHAAIEASKAAVAAAPKGSKERAELVRRVDRIYERHERVLRSRERPAVGAAQVFTPMRVNADLLAKLRPYVAPAEFLPREVVHGAQQILPGIVVAIAVAEDSGRVDVLAAESVADIARAMMPNTAERPIEWLRRIAIDNLRRLPFPPFERLDDDTFVLEVEEPFVASRLTFLDELVQRTAPRRPRKHGVLLAIPRRRTMLLHLPNSVEVLAELKRMKTVANQVFELTPRSKLSPHVYYIAPDGRSQVVTSPTGGGPFTEMLYGRGGLPA